MKSPTVIVLAAGQGKRFTGSAHKLTQRLGQYSVLGTTLRHVLDSGLPMILVTTIELAHEARNLLDVRDIEIMHPAGLGASSGGMGMGASIAAGVSARPESPGWLVLPGDMPMVQAATLRAVAQGLEPYPAVYAQYHGRQGHPVAFAAELFSELVALDGDEGAKRLLARYPSQGIDVDDPGVLLDVDTAADLDKLRNSIREHEMSTASSGMRH